MSLHVAEAMQLHQINKQCRDSALKQKEHSVANMYVWTSNGLLHGYHMGEPQERQDVCELLMCIGRSMCSPNLLKTTTK